MHISITKSGVSPKVAIERVQSKARFGYAEREQARASLIVIRLACLNKERGANTLSGIDSPQIKLPAPALS